MRRREERGRGGTRSIAFCTIQSARRRKRGPRDERGNGYRLAHYTPLGVPGARRCCGGAAVVTSRQSNGELMNENPCRRPSVSQIHEIIRLRHGAAVAATQCGAALPQHLRDPAFARRARRPRRAPVPAGPPETTARQLHLGPDVRLRGPEQEGCVSAARFFRSEAPLLLQAPLRGGVPVRRGCTAFSILAPPGERGAVRGTGGVFLVPDAFGDVGGCKACHRRFQGCAGVRQEQPGPRLRADPDPRGGPETVPHRGVRFVPPARGIREGARFAQYQHRLPAVRGDRPDHPGADVARVLCRRNGQADRERIPRSRRDGHSDARDRPRRPAELRGDRARGAGKRRGAVAGVAAAAGRAPGVYRSAGGGAGGVHPAARGADDQRRHLLLQPGALSAGQHRVGSCAELPLVRAHRGR